MYIIIHSRDPHDHQFGGTVEYFNVPRVIPCEHCDRIFVRLVQLHIFVRLVTTLQRYGVLYKLFTHVSIAIERDYYSTNEKTKEK